MYNEQLSHNRRKRTYSAHYSRAHYRAPDNFIKKTKTRHKAGAASAHVCFHRQPGNKSSRHMKADSVVSCDGAKGVLIFRFPEDTQRGLAPLVSLRCTNTHHKKGKKEWRHTDVGYSAMCVEACYHRAAQEPLKQRL